MAAAKIIVVEKNEGEKIAYDVSTTKIIFGDDDLMVNIKNRERDEEVTLDICKDTQDGLTVGVNTEAREYVAQVIIPASVLGALTAIGAVAYKIIKWFQAQEKQTTDIEDLKKQEKEDIKAMEDELCLLTYAVLACLKGLKERQ